MKKIMILGAGIYQLPLIKKAKSLGLYTIVCSIKGNYPGFKYADKCYYVDTTDTEQILEIANYEKISGICTTGTDVAITTLGTVCEKMHLSGVSKEAAYKATNKLKMKCALKSAGVKTAEFIEINSLTQLKIAYQKLHKPVILKVIDKSGSRGIIKIENAGNLEGAYKYCCQCTNSSYMLLEEYIEGEEIGVDGFIKDGKIELYLPHKKLIISNGKTNIPLGHELPLEMSDKNKRNLFLEIRKAITALDIDNCAFNADVFMKDGEAYIIEVGARCGATGIPEIISQYCGFDYYEKLIKVAIGDKVNFDFKKSNYSCSNLIFSTRSGTLKSITYDDINGVDVSIDVELGEQVNKVENGTDRLGQIIASGHSLNEIRDKVSQFMNSLVIVID